MPTSTASCPILLLLGSNVFMTFAWYGHLKYKSSPLMLVILASWGIAFFEYCCMVPANRSGSAVYQRAAAQGHAGSDHAAGVRRLLGLVPGQPLKWNHWAGFALIVVAAWLIFLE